MNGVINSIVSEDFSTLLLFPFLHFYHFTFTLVAVPVVSVSFTFALL